MKRDRLSLILAIILTVLILTVGVLVAVFFSRSKTGETAELRANDVVSVSAEESSMEEHTSESGKTDSVRDVGGNAGEKADEIAGGSEGTTGSE